MPAVLSKQNDTRSGRAGRLAFVAAFGVVLFSLAARQSFAAGSGVPSFDHVFVIVMENHAYSEIIGNTSQAPYINQLASQHGLATDYFAVAHPSLPNYLALVGGSTFGITSDCTTCFVNQPNLAADRIAPSGRAWTAYMETMPSTCFLGNASTYVQKHNPFIYFDNIRTDPTQCNNVVPFTQLGSDLASATTTPDFVWITPNLCSDMHDCSISTGDTWLKNNVSTILNSPAYTSQNSLVLITWDEDDSSQSNQVATLVVAKSVPAGFKSSMHYTHYSLLKTIEQAWGLAPLTANDGNANAMSDFFDSTNTPPSAPVGLSATAGDAQVSLSWTASSGATSYNAKRGTVSGGPYTTLTSVTNPSYIDPGVTNSTSYFYVITAVNSGGESGNSNEASATPTSPSADKITAVHETNDTAVDSTSGAVTIPATTAGDTLVVIASLYTGVSKDVAAIVDSSNTPWDTTKQVTGAVAGSYGRTEIWWREGVQGGITSVTLRQRSGPTPIGKWAIKVLELSGVASASALDTSQTAQNVLITTLQTGLTPQVTAAGEFVLGAVSTTGGTNLTLAAAASAPTSGWTALTDVSTGSVITDIVGRAAYFKSTVLGAQYRAAWSGSALKSGGGAIVVFKSTGAGGAAALREKPKPGSPVPHR